MGATTVSPPDAPDALADNLSWLLQQVSHALSTEVTAALEGLNVTPRAHCVLSTAASGEYTQTDLAHAVGMDKTTMVVTLDELELAGLARREPSPTDRRARVIAVTPAGERMIAEGEEIVRGVHNDVLASLPADQRDALLGALRNLAGTRLSDTTPCSQAPRRPRSSRSK